MEQGFAQLNANLSVKELMRNLGPDQQTPRGFQISRRAFLKSAIAIAALASVNTVNPWVARASLTLAFKSYGGILGQLGSSCTGSIMAGSTSMTVNAVPANMQINDWIIVEI